MNASRRLIQLRRSPKFSSGSANAVAYDATAEWLTLIHNGALAVFNFAGREQPVPMPSGRRQLLLRSDSKEPVPTKLLPARTSLIYISEEDE